MIVAILTTILEFIGEAIIVLLKTALVTLKVTAKTLYKLSKVTAKIGSKVTKKAGKKVVKSTINGSKKAVKNATNKAKSASISLINRGVSSIQDEVPTEFVPQSVVVLGKTVKVTSAKMAKTLLFVVKAGMTVVKVLLIFCRAIQVIVATFGAVFGIITVCVVMIMFTTFGGILTLDFDSEAGSDKPVRLSEAIVRTEHKTISGCESSVWSTRGKTSVPHYVQYYANTDAELEFRDEHMKTNGTGSGDWANMPFNGGDVSGNACGACALANAISGQLGEEITPDIIVSYFNSKGANTVLNASNAVKTLQDKYPDIAFMDINGDSPQYSCWNCGGVSSKPTKRNQTIDMDKVDAWLDKGACIVFSIDANFSFGGRNRDGHFICCYGRDNEGYYVSDSRNFEPFNDESCGGALICYALDEPYDWKVVFTGGVQGPFVVINKDKLN